MKRYDIEMYGDDMREEEAPDGRWVEADEATVRIFELEQHNIGLVEMNRACIHDRDHAQARLAELEAELEQRAQVARRWNCTPAERAVLDAMASATIERRWSRAHFVHESDADFACEAELARREAAK